MERARLSQFDVAFIRRGRGQGGDDARWRRLGRRNFMLSMLAASIGAANLAYAGGGPLGGQITAGIGQIQQGATTTTIRQSSQTLSLNWQSFDLAANQTVNFLQPGRDAVAINRIFSSTPSDIFGRLNANGQVWLINPNGVLFGASAQVNVGGLVASALDVDDGTLDAGQHRFAGAGNGRIVNRGTLAADGGYVALLGNQVSNQGVIRAQWGTVALAGGSAVTLTFAGSQLVHVQVDRSTLDNLAENRQLIVADGGRVIMTAGARDALLASVVNNSGVVQAQSVQNHAGTITLLGGMAAGQVDVGGTLDASAPHDGDGGAIETSAAHFSLARDARITAAAPAGSAGSWLIDPTDLTIDSAAATTISNTLNGGTSVTETTTASGASGVGAQSPGNGDINVDAAVNWSNANAMLTLQAYNGVNVNAPINGAGKVLLNAGGAVGGDLAIAAGASIVGGAGVTLVAANRFINNGGAAAVSTGTSAPWLVYAAAPAQITAGGLSPGFIQYNAPYPTAPAAPGNGFLYSLAPMLTLGLTGNASKTYATLHALVAPGEGRALSLNDLDGLAQKITDYYHDHGYPLATAYVPAQTLRDGVVRITVVEAHYGKVMLQNQSSVGSHPLDATLAPLQAGQPVSEYGLERSLLLLSDIPGAISTSVMRPGEAEGTSDLIVNVTSAPRYTGTLGMDDYGNAQTDRVRFSGSFDVNGLFHQGDLLDLGGVTSGGGMGYGHVGYRYLLTGQGTTLGLAASGLQYKLGNDLSDLHAHGTATTQSVNLSQPFIRHTAGNLYAQLEFDHKRLYDDIDLAGLQTHRHANSWVLTVAGDQRDRTGVTNVNLGGTYGRLYLDNFQTLFADYFGARTAGSYVKFDYSVSRLQQLNDINAIYIGFSGQHANKNLDTSEQFYLGGPNTVRGYDMGVVSGAQGNLATIEYRRNFSIAGMPGPWQWSAFVDSGRVQAYKDPFLPGPNRARLSSAGVGVHWSAPHDWVVASSVAAVIGNKPALAGPHAGTAARFWVQVQKGFY